MLYPADSRRQETLLRESGSPASTIVVEFADLAAGERRGEKMSKVCADADIDWDCWKCRAQLRALYQSGDNSLDNLIRGNLDRHLKSGKHEK